MKCPLCDGTVVNGRCKECGMPYRNDEILYHLNESRSDHYRHASDKARKIMQAQQRAGTRTNAGTRKGAESRTASVNRSNSRTVSRQTLQEQQKKIRQEAIRKMTDSVNTAATIRTTQKKQSTAGNIPDRPEKAKKRSKLGFLWALVLILAALAPMADDLGNLIKETVQSEFEDSSAEQISEEMDSAAYFYSYEDGNQKYYSIAAGFGPAEAGVEFDAGNYEVYTNCDEVTFTVKRKTADGESYILRDGDEGIRLSLKEGDRILVESEESDYDSIYLLESEE
ncbi:hypothetical protein [Blautia sp. MSJ-19]|uniref:hypothetical protein n=1 Tax=Blautia sp. MSJ-19 TaxID=2841517 RepID=UPI001C0F3B18|nr:hypothetical protein [Blautia sp. MSJ-19]MBU5480389.1 hypothetical protein [Blautia sp. MSJ-19]